MRVSLLAHDLSGNNMAWVGSVARVLSRRQDVRTIGPATGAEVHPGFCDASPVVHAMRYGNGRLPGYWRTVQEIAEAADGDVVYAFEAFPDTLGAALLAKRSRNARVVLDVSDWFAGRYYQRPVPRRWLSYLRHIREPHAHLALMERAAKWADQVTAHSTFLQRRYGAVSLPHGCDCQLFDPDRYDRDALRREWNVEDRHIILFAGQPQRHKGIDLIVDALAELQRPEVALMMVGPQTDYVDEIARRGRDAPIVVGPRCHSQIPMFLSLCDLVVLPQRNTPFAQAQLPQKMYEPMAMAKPIIATNVSDMPKILEGCGWVVEPDRPDLLAEAMRHVIDHPDEAAAAGRRAREKCLKEYSYDALEAILEGVFARLDEG